MNNRKTIAVLMCQPEEFYQRRLMKGITAQAFSLGYDCAVFSTEYKDVLSAELMKGAANIFELINFELIDGVIIVPDTIKDKCALEKIVRLIKDNFSGPVLSLDMEMPDFGAMHCDDGAAMEALTLHMIDTHGCKYIDFMRGIPDHPHSIRREEGYKRALRKRGIAVEEERIHDGDFWYDKGDQTADEILSSSLPLPQAVVCASDTMAISLCDALAERGIAVPEQIAVTGYDSIVEAREHDPSIASARIPADLLGKNAVAWIDAQIGGREFVPIEEKINIISAQSCGCGGRAVDSKLTQELLYTDNNYRTPYYSTSNDMMGKLISADNLDTLLYDVNWYAYQIKPFRSFMLMLCDDWVSTTGSFRTSGYPEKMHMRFVNRADINESHINDIEFDTSLMIPPEQADTPKPTVYYFTALHFFSRCFGYTVISFDGDTCTPCLDYREWIRCVCNGIECLRRSLHIMAMYERVKMSAETDALTGLLNRNAFNSYIERLSDNEKNAMIMMVDLNFLKLINDTFGHLAGDKALRTVAGAIRSVCKEEKAFRFGGDEFMIIGEGVYDDKRINGIIDGINEYLDEYNRTSDDPYKVMASFGAVSAAIDPQTKIDGLIRAADTVMYKNKQLNKAAYKDPFKK